MDKPGLNIHRQACASALANIHHPRPPTCRPAAPEQPRSSWPAGTRVRIGAAAASTSTAATISKFVRMNVEPSASSRTQRRGGAGKKKARETGATCRRTRLGRGESLPAQDRGGAPLSPRCPSSLAPAQWTSMGSSRSMINNERAPTRPLARQVSAAGLARPTHLLLDRQERRGRRLIITQTFGPSVDVNRLPLFYAFGQRLCR